MAEAEKTPEPDVEALFQSMGSKLGWFQFKDVDSAIKSLSQSAKKKSTRSRVFERNSQRQTPSKANRKSSKDSDAGSKKKPNLRKPTNSTKTSKKKDSLIQACENKNYSASEGPVDYGVLSEHSSPDDHGPVESTRIGSSVFRTDSNNIVDLSLSPVSASLSHSIINQSELEDSYKALKINANKRKSRPSNVGEQKNASCCSDEDDEVFYSVTNPCENNPPAEHGEEAENASTETNVSGTSLDYVEVDDKAVSTGSLELRLMEKLSDDDYEEHRSFFTSWALKEDEDQNRRNRTKVDKDVMTKKMANLDLKDSNLSLKSVDPNKSAMDSTSCESDVHVNSKSDVSGNSAGSELCEVEDKCVGTTPTASDSTRNDSSTVDSTQNDSASVDSIHNDSASIDSPQSESASVDSPQSESASVEYSASIDSPQNDSASVEYSASIDSPQNDSASVEYSASIDSPQNDSASVEYSASIDSPQNDFTSVEYSASIDSPQSDSASVDSPQNECASLAPLRNGSLSANSSNSDSHIHNKTEYFDTEDKPLSQRLSLAKSRRSSIWEKSVYHDAVEGFESPGSESGMKNAQETAVNRDHYGIDNDSLPDLSLSDPESEVFEKESTLSKAQGSMCSKPGSSGQSCSVKKLSDESSDDDLECFFSKLRTPLRERVNTNTTQASLDDFLVDDDDSSEDVDDEEGNSNSGFFHINVDREIGTPPSSRTNQKNSSSTASYRAVFKIDSDSDSDEENFMPTKPKTSGKPAFKTPKPVARNKKENEPRNGDKTPKSTSHVRTASFLKSLSASIPDTQKDIEAGRYTRHFGKLREDLTKKLFLLYNSTVFDDKLPKDLPIKWNGRLLKTAGFCRYKKTRSGGNVLQSVEIELSIKVCDSAERVRDTLIHELCHAAVWIINGTKDGHGPYWKHWARKSNFVHPELPVIARCHNYSIATKYTYRCIKCGYQIGRHSKSLDTAKKVCGLCHGKFELLVSGKSSTLSNNGGDKTPYTPRAPNRFALFVKENYKMIKDRNSTLKHREVMKALSKEFAEKNSIKGD